MKAYLVVTGWLFALFVPLHLWRAIVEWPRDGLSVGFVAGMGALIVVPGVLAVWAWRLLRSVN